MNLNDAFPSKYLKADDVPFPRTFIMYGARQEEIGQQKDQKVVLYFNDEPKGLIINKTVWAQIANIVGSDDTDHWPGKAIELYRDMVNFQGKMVPGLRARHPQQRFPQGQQAPVQQSVQQQFAPVTPNLDPRTGQPANEHAAVPGMAPVYAVSDEIPDPALDPPVLNRSRQSKAPF